MRVAQRNYCCGSSERRDQAIVRLSINLTPRKWCPSVNTRRFACQAGSAQAVQQASVHTQRNCCGSTDRGSSHCAALDKLTPHEWCLSANLDGSLPRRQCAGGSTSLRERAHTWVAQRGCCRGSSERGSSHCAALDNHTPSSDVLCVNWMVCSARLLPCEQREGVSDKCLKPSCGFR